MAETLSPRTALRDLRRRVEAAARERFGQHRRLRLYLDTSDGDPRNFDACIQYEHKPAGSPDWLLYPPEGVITEPTQEAALRKLLLAIQHEPNKKDPQ